MRFSVAAERFIDDVGILGRIPQITPANGWREQNLVHTNCGGIGMTHNDQPAVIACNKCQVQTKDLDAFVSGTQEC